MREPRYNFGFSLWTQRDQRKLYLVGGQDAEGKCTGSIESLDLNDNMSDWTTSNCRLQYALCKNELFCYNSNLYSVGGYDLFHNQPKVQAIDVLNGTCDGD